MRGREEGDDLTGITVPVFILRATQSAREGLISLIVIDVSQILCCGNDSTILVVDLRVRLKFGRGRQERTWPVESRLHRAFAGS